MKNTNQLVKNLLSDKRLKNPIHFIHYNDLETDDENGNQIINVNEEYKVLKKLIIKIHEVYPTHNILILSRYNYNIDYLFESDNSFLDDLGTKIKFAYIDDLDMDGMSIHKSKGLTYDEVIIIGLNKWFPKKDYKDFWITTLFKPIYDTYNEERRVFYVGLTRTSNNLFIMYNDNENNRSEFVNELYEIYSNEKNKHVIKEENDIKCICYVKKRLHYVMKPI